MWLYVLNENYSKEMKMHSIIITYYRNKLINVKKSFIEKSSLKNSYIFS